MEGIVISLIDNRTAKVTVQRVKFYSKIRIKRFIKKNFLVHVPEYISNLKVGSKVNLKPIAKVSKRKYFLIKDVTTGIDSF